MTIKEIAAEKGVLTTTTSVNESISNIVFRLYHSYDPKYYLVLQTLNNRLDWNNVEVNSEIKYLEKTLCNDIDEIISQQ